ncbi:hypothetical protein KHA96_16280 [Bacillus sp. FJAT-49711]|uniref:hypothetical protein n=1 Tax=Bacillus sp. FJAT-49711 TaxID=2833585 RepID=UPI001BC9B137|nr:hypothetical protein [Bacillus sp. FJAT-49711]MBS4219872.1 hypothetical protein [Bacillus sp. FJAT-49711]
MSMLGFVAGFGFGQVHSDDAHGDGVHDVRDARDDGHGGDHDDNQNDALGSLGNP